MRKRTLVSEGLAKEDGPYSGSQESQLTFWGNASRDGKTCHEHPSEDPAPSVMPGWGLLGDTLDSSR